MLRATGTGYPVARRTCAWASLLGLAAALVACATDDAGSANAFYRKSVEALRAGDAVAAAELAREALQRDDRSSSAWTQLARAESARGRHGAAADAYMRLLEFEPGNATFRHNLGNALFRAGRFAESVEQYARALEARPEYLLATFHHGWALRQLGRDAEAESAFSRCLEIVPQDDRERRTQLDCLYQVGALRERAGDDETAVLILEQVLGALPQHAEARHLLGMAYRRSGRLVDAEQQLEIHRQLLAARRSAPIEWSESP